jgi:hypothetical protein
MLEVYDDKESTEGVRRPWSNVVIVSLLVALGWFIFELTAQPALGAVAVCVKFGWNDFRTAWWLRERDPNRRRGAACFSLFVASAFSKMAVSAFVLMFAYGLVNALLQPPQPANQGANWDALVPVFIAMSLTLLLGFGISALATARALWLALRFHCKLWLDPAVHQARRCDVWPPNVPTSNTNRARPLIFTGLFMIYFPIMFAALVIVAGMAWDGRGPQQEWLAPFFLSIVVAIISGPILMLLARDFLAKRVLAQYAEECWGNDEPKDEEKLP